MNYEDQRFFEIAFISNVLGPNYKFCLFLISDRPYQNMCDPHLFYGFPKKKKKNFFFLGNP